MLAIYLYFMNRDLSDYNPRKIPDTDAKIEMKFAHRSTVDAFMQYVAMGNCEGFLDLPLTLGNKVTSAKLYEAYTEYCSKQPQHVKRVESRVFVKEVVGLGFDCTVLNVNGASKRGFRLPCVSEIEAFLKGKKKWDRHQA